MRLLRPGAVTAAQLRTVVGELLMGAELESPRVPGTTPSHYAPITPMIIVPAGEIDAQAAALSEGGKRIAVLAQRLPLKSYKYVTWINAGRRPDAVRARPVRQPAHARQSGLPANPRAGRARRTSAGTPSAIASPAPPAASAMVMTPGPWRFCRSDALSRSGTRDLNCLAAVGRGRS